VLDARFGRWTTTDKPTNRQAASDEIDRHARRWSRRMLSRDDDDDDAPPRERHTATAAVVPSSPYV
jgi:hypothetical protein